MDNERIRIGPKALDYSYQNPRTKYARHNAAYEGRDPSPRHRRKIGVDNRFRGNYCPNIYTTRRAAAPLLRRTAPPIELLPESYRQWNPRGIFPQEMYDELKRAS